MAGMAESPKELVDYSLVISPACCMLLVHLGSLTIATIATHFRILAENLVVLGRSSSCSFVLA
jgi:hypothetical protein